MNAKNKIDWDLKKKPDVWKEKKLSQSQLDRLELWRVFSIRQDGCLPPQLAADFLRMSSEGVRKAAVRGWISYIKIGRNRYYGKKDLENYKFTISRKFPENQTRHLKSSPEFTISQLRET